MIGIIGVGASVGHDDIACHTVNYIKEYLADKPQQKHLKVDYYDRPGIYLLEVIKKFKRLHLIDAIVGTKNIATIYRYQNIDVFKKNNVMLSSHGMGLIETLLLGEVLECLPQQIIIHGIEIGENNTSSNEVNYKLKLACQTLANQIIKEITL